MTAPDVRTAAQTEADSRYVGNPDHHSLSPAFAELRREGFIAGAVWGAALVTPTREQIAEALSQAYQQKYRPSERLPVNHHDLRAADAVLALMRQ